MLNGIFDRKALIALSWQLQITDARNDKGEYRGPATLDQELANDFKAEMRKPGADPVALSAYFAMWMKGSKALHGYYLPVLFNFLSVCKKGEATSLLESLAKHLNPHVDTPAQEQSAAQLAGTLASALASVIQTKGDRTALEVVRNESKRMRDSTPSFKGADELFDLADRSHDLLKELDAGENPRMRPSSIVDSQSCIESLRIARGWLRPFTADQARKLDISLHPAGLHFFIQKFRARFTDDVREKGTPDESGFEGVVYQAILKGYETRCNGFHPRAACALSLRGKAEKIECTVVNYTGKQATNLALNVNVDGHEHRNDLPDLEPFNEESRDLSGLDGFGKNHLAVKLESNGSKISLATEKLVFHQKKNDSEMKEVRENLPKCTLSYKSTRETIKNHGVHNLISYPWWKKLGDSLKEGGSIKILYGLPRVGKTTGLLKLRENLIADLKSSLCNASRSAGTPVFFPLYLNLEANQLTSDFKMAMRLLAGDVKDEFEQVAQELKLLIENNEHDVCDDGITRCGKLLERLENARRILERDAGNSGGNITADLLREYFSSIDAALREAHRDWRLLLILDEWSAFWKASPEVARRLQEFFGILVRRASDLKMIQCSAGLVDMQLASDYSIGRTRITQYASAAETDFDFIAATPFDTPGMISLLHNWLYPPDEEGIVCDDLAAEMLHEYTGGHSLLIQVLGRYLQAGVRDEQLRLPITYEDAYRICSLSLPDDQGGAPYLRDLRGAFRDALLTVWTGLAGSGLGTNDLPKLRAVLEGESWASLQEMIDCGLIAMSNTDLAPRLRIQGLKSFYQDWLSSI